MSRNDRLVIGPRVSGLWLRILVLVVAVAAALGLHLPLGFVVAIAIAAGLGAFLPQAIGVWASMIILIWSLLSQTPRPLEVAVVIAAVHLLHVLGALLLVVPVTARVSLRALGPTAAGFAVMQAIGQGIGRAVLLLPEQAGAPGTVIVGSAAVLIGVCAALWIWERRRLESFSRAPAAIGRSTLR